MMIRHFLFVFPCIAGEEQYVLEDEEYRMQYKCELRDAVMRAKERPCSLFSGYTFCLSKYIQPSVDVLQCIIRYTGAKVTSQQATFFLMKPQQGIALICASILYF
jgi:hypothetical protein